MADFDVDGLDDLMLNLEAMADIPEEVLGEMLVAKGEVIKAAQERELQSLDFDKKTSTGQLAGSIKITRKITRDARGVPGIRVYPADVRRGTKTRNAEVGFIVEYGAPKRGIAPRQWMRVANEKAAEEATRAAAKPYNDWLDSKGL